MRWLPTVLLLAGCPWVGPDSYQTVRDGDGDGLDSVRYGGLDCDDANPNVGVCDADGDGERNRAAGGDDCDDDDANVHPGADELCNGADDDCDALVDEDATDVVSVFEDLDGDGFGDRSLAPACADAAAPGVLVDGDCDDGTDSIHPGADEFCDGIDRDCDGDGNDPNSLDALTLHADDDGDGFGGGPAISGGCRQPGLAPIPTPTDEDCNDNDATVFPGAPEIAYDGIDQGCDGGGNEWDIDGDGFEERAPDNDCDDTNPNIHPGAIEVCDGVDTDCDGLADGADDDISDLEKTPIYPDADADGFGDDAAVVLFCGGTLPDGFLLTGGDCDGTDDTIHPDAHEIHYELSEIDQDCDGGANEFDADGDGAEARGSEPDCDDTAAGIHPGAAETCDGIDADCDGLDDPLDPDVSPLFIEVRYPDLDGDGFGDQGAAVPTCVGTAPPHLIADGSDCDDQAHTVNPTADELCGDAVDNDCDGLTDSLAVDAVTLYQDTDGDGHGAFPISACPGEPGTSGLNDDCNDAEATVYPGAPEICGDGIAQDCSRPENATDCDGDGVDGVSFGGTDCDDDNAGVAPGALEVCDAVDNDCNGLVDALDPHVDLSTATEFYEDADGDGFGGTLLTSGCTPPAGAVADGSDCDDEDEDVFPTALETCNGQDDNCNHEVDEEPVVAPLTWYIDRDGDGAGDPSGAFAQGCTPPNAHYVLTAGDCNDFDAATQGVLWYRDADGDGFGLDSDVLSQCTMPVGYVQDSGDCADGDAARSPGALEICDGIDNDCDGLTDDADTGTAATTTWYPDVDGDGFGGHGGVQACDAPPSTSATPGDCNDTDTGVRPGAIEICDGRDNDCDGDTDDDDVGLANAPYWYPDTDSDGFGDSLAGQPFCAPPAGFVGNAGDCDDHDVSINPFGQEICGGGDEDCDGQIDDADPDVANTAQWFLDVDGDGYGSPTGGTPGCVQPAHTVQNALDCNDGSAHISPDATEICDGIDNDCNSAVDDASGGQDFWIDADGDGFGDPHSTPVQAGCNAPIGRAANDLDCNDGNAAVSPAALFELCDALDVDENCDGSADGIVIATGLPETDPSRVPVNTEDAYADADGDGFFVDHWQGLRVCPEDLTLDMSTAPGRDCDDALVLVNPHADEVCDNEDNNCNGTVDGWEELAHGEGGVFFLDLDGDGLGAGVVSACALDHDVVGNSDDCDDFDAGIGPAIDRYEDNDSDGFGNGTLFPACPNSLIHSDIDGDCDDYAPHVNPDALEACDGFDNDCDGRVDSEDALDHEPSLLPQYHPDQDADGYGDPFGQPVGHCSPLDDYADNADDCDDNTPLSNPNEALIGTGGFLDLATAAAACGPFVRTFHFTPGSHFVDPFTVPDGDHYSFLAAEEESSAPILQSNADGFFSTMNGSLTVRGLDFQLPPSGSNAGRFVNALGGVIELEDVNIDGQDAVGPLDGSAIGLELTNSQLTWEGGSIHDCHQTAVKALGGNVWIEDVDFLNNEDTGGTVTISDLLATGGVTLRHVKVEGDPAQIETGSLYLAQANNALLQHIRMVETAPLWPGPFAVIEDLRMASSNDAATAVRLSTGTDNVVLHQIEIAGYVDGIQIASTSGTFIDQGTFVAQYPIRNGTPGSVGMNNSVFIEPVDQSTGCTWASLFDPTISGFNVTDVNVHACMYDVDLLEEAEPFDLVGYFSGGHAPGWTLLPFADFAIEGAGEFGQDRGYGGGSSLFFPHFDEDHDGVPDDFELYWFGDTSPDPFDDVDHDGWDLLDEYYFSFVSTCPVLGDSDDDGFPDSFDCEPLDPAVGHPVSCGQ